MHNKRKGGSHHKGVDLKMDIVFCLTVNAKLFMRIVSTRLR
jgi:hypothetical protein